ncbi:MAG TPA: hypothetical protein VLC28_06100 [Flavitalea sp.]|nr:hypothetical protein [Flavitalea sp.]
MNVIWLMKLIVWALTMSATLHVTNNILSNKRKFNENRRELMLVTYNTPTVVYQK